MRSESKFQDARMEAAKKVEAVTFYDLGGLAMISYDFVTSWILVGTNIFVFILVLGAGFLFFSQRFALKFEFRNLAPFHLLFLLLLLGDTGLSRRATV